MRLASGGAASPNLGRAELIVLPFGAVKFGLYAEQLTATAFVASRALNQKLWLYRMRPSVAHQGFTRMQDNPDVRLSWLLGTIRSS